MSSMKGLYTEYFPKLVTVLPMDDAHFIAQLFTCQLLPGDARESIAAKATRADKASLFLNNYIEKGFDDDGSNPLFLELLKLMQRSDNLVLKRVANDIDSQIKRIPLAPPKLKGSLNSKPKLTELLPYFEEVAKWDAVCPFLLKDDTGAMTSMISDNNHGNVARCRGEMLQRFLQEISNPTWQNVVDALRMGKYNNLADKIKEDL